LSPASQRSEGLDDGWSDELWIKTSPKVRKLQRVLYRKAKAEPRWRFYSLYGELYRRDVLSDALDQVIANGGAPGVGWVRGRGVGKDPAVREAWLLALAEELRTKRYGPAGPARLYLGRIRPGPSAGRWASHGERPGGAKCGGDRVATDLGGGLPRPLLRLPAETAGRIRRWTKSGKRC